MEGSMYQPSSCIGGAREDINQEVAYVKISFVLDLGSGVLYVRADAETIIEEPIGPGKPYQFEVWIPPRYVTRLGFEVEPSDWSVSISSVTVEWADEIQAPPAPLDEEGFDLWQWIKDHPIHIGAAGLGVAGLILFWPKRK